MSIFSLHVTLQVCEQWCAVCTPFLCQMLVLCHLLHVCCACEVGTIGMISDCQPEGPGFNSRPGRGLNFGDLLLPHCPWTGTSRQDVGLVSRHSIKGLKTTHTHVGKSRVMPVLWTVTPSPAKRARPRRDHVSYCLCSP